MIDYLNGMSDTSSALVYGGGGGDCFAFSSHPFYKYSFFSFNALFSSTSFSVNRAIKETDEHCVSLVFLSLFIDAAESPGSLIILNGLGKASEVSKLKK